MLKIMLAQSTKALLELIAIIVSDIIRVKYTRLRTVPTIVIAHTFCASPDNRISYR